MRFALQRFRETEINNLNICSHSHSIQLYLFGFRIRAHLTDIHAFETMTGETLTAEMLKAMGATDNEHLIAEIVKLYSQ